MQVYLLYIDPGSGSYLIQVVIAAILGIAFFFRNIVTVIKHFFYRLFRKKRSPKEET